MGIVTVPNAFGVEYTNININLGTDNPDCESSDSCHSPSFVLITTGMWIQWKNLDSAPHTITSGSLSSGINGLFDSLIIYPDSTFSHQFTVPGIYDYFCILHPWAKGSVNVIGETSDTTQLYQPSSSSLTSILTLDPLPSEVDVGERLTFSGTLKSANGNPVVRQTVQILGNKIVDGVTVVRDIAVCERYTNNSGIFSCFWSDILRDIQQRKEFTISFSAEFSGNPAFESSTSQAYNVLFQSYLTKPAFGKAMLPPEIEFPTPNFDKACWNTRELTKCETDYDNDGVREIVPHILALYKLLDFPQQNYGFSFGIFDTEDRKIISGDGQDLLVFSILIENESNSPATIELRGFKMYDSKDRIFTTSTSSRIQPLGGEIENAAFNWREICPSYDRLMEIQPGIKGKMKLCFEVPEDSDHFKVVYDGSKYSSMESGMVLIFDRGAMERHTEKQAVVEGTGTTTSGIQDSSGPTKSTSMFIELLYLIIGVTAVAGIVGAVLIAKRGSNTKSAQQKLEEYEDEYLKTGNKDLEEYEKEYLARQGQRPSPKPAEKKETSSSCDNCGAPFKKPDAKFCGKCGTPSS